MVNRLLMKNISSSRNDGHSRKYYTGEDEEEKSEKIEDIWAVLGCDDFHSSIIFTLKSSGMSRLIPQNKD